MSTHVEHDPTDVEDLPGELDNGFDVGFVVGVDDGSVSLFEGDEGGLEHGQRHALVTLLKQRFISA
ncbi:hypothetical protein QWJ41_21500, partial [Nocardioides sp. SOB44]|nr:hypothetical protein [Nocardioides cremeus]